jgi:putative colanic acid biosynthesis UDP-glucose lipid carrier transferase
MIDNAPISASRFIPTLSVVRSSVRLRDQIDQKKLFFFLKRIFDIAFSAIFIIGILSWLLPLLAILIRLSSKGPVFFLQKRIGFGGRSFTCYKFRTMVQNEEADLLQASENDKRVTRLGWFLRKSNIDEFPQFFNVLKGDMSIVGPRPHMYTDCHHFSMLLPGYKFRNMVKPGLDRAGAGKRISWAHCYQPLHPDALSLGSLLYPQSRVET